MPWVTPLSLETALPWSDLGPVLSFALARLAAIRAGLGGRLGFVGGSVSLVVSVSDSAGSIGGNLIGV
jgi:hypothetical protein